jgi:3-methyl-2-oxobutanoate hydroxymethyltransferase|tara:strand:+ start:3948 stop:4772 length:825 start_codon:yes stop_codon:yes gene_type:complete
VNAAELQAKKALGEPLVVLTCSDYPTAVWQEAAGVDIVFCADSLGTNLLGYEDEREVTMDDMIHHLKAVRRGLKGGHSYLLADLPYGSCDTPKQALGNALRFVFLGADGVKFEGFKPETVRTLRQRGIDVCCHLGLNPQIHAEKKVQARTAQDAIRLLQECEQLQEAGAQFIVLEAIPERVGRIVSERLSIPTIGIAAGRYTDGQVLVVTDALGVHDFASRHIKRFAEIGPQSAAGVAQYVAEVREHRFPTASHRWKMKQEEADAFDAWLQDQQ